MSLDWNSEIKVKYCIPLWLRDQQIRTNVTLVKERLQLPTQEPSGPIAVVGFGPSLEETWPTIRPFSSIITCSGSHRFLLDHGIVPSWHVEVDPRAHKIALLGQPHPSTTYLIASTCHPDLVRYLLDHKAKIQLWHIFDSDAEAISVLPRDEWALTGGPDAGMRAMGLARFLGYKDLHIFGMDGCYSASKTHTTEHPNHKLSLGSPVEYDGVTYQTTAALLECSKAVVHELNMLTDVKATFYGEGLTQATMRHYSRDPNKKGALLAITRPALISSEMRDLNAQLHQTNPFYGISAEKWVDAVVEMAEKLETKNILDYGCGKGLLGRGIPWQIAEYDPAIPGKETLPKPADLVCCIDVLEHIEPDKLRFVLDDLRRCILKVGFFTISTTASSKSLANGMNAHLIQKPKRWWKRQLEAFFTIGQLWQIGSELIVVVAPKVEGVGLSIPVLVTKGAA